MLRVPNALGCSVSCCNSVPSSRERRSKSRPSQPDPVDPGNVLSKGDDFEEPKPEEVLSSGLCVERDSPQITDSKLSSIPMKSRMTLRVRRCQKDSLPSIADELPLKGPFSTSSPAFAPTMSLTICSWPTLPGIVSARWLITLALLRLVSFSISSNRTLECSILQFSILSLVSASTVAASFSSTASILFCKLDLLL